MSVEMASAAALNAVNHTKPRVVNMSACMCEGTRRCGQTTVTLCNPPFECQVNYILAARGPWVEWFESSVFHMADVDERLLPVPARL